MRTPRAARLALPLVVGALALAGCSSDGAATPEANGLDLVEAGKLTICTNPPFEPFEYTDDSGAVVGMDIDIAAEVAADLGLEPAVTITPFETIESGTDLEVGNCDLVASGITITEERQAKFDFSDPYFDSDLGILVKAGSGIASEAELAGVKIGVQQATTGDRWVSDRGLTGVQFEDSGLPVEALRTDQVGAVVNDIAVLGPFTGDGLEVVATIPTGEQFGLGVKKGNAALLDAVNATLARIMTDGTFDTIYTEHIGTAPLTD